jgi:hypothetical protein
VLRVHFCFGLAPHIGQRTDSTCRGVSFTGSTPVLFSFQREYLVDRNARLDLSRYSNPGPCLAKCGIHNPD